jgi:cyanophycinase
MNIKFLILIILFGYSLISSQPKGHLVIVGGVQTSSIVEKFVELAGKKDARIIVIPNAGSNPVENSKIQIKEFEDLGADADYLLFTRETADADSNLKKLESANAVFFLGGDQSDLTRDMLGTKLLDRVYQIYYNGGVVGGSSAGAAVMSEVMITGNELVNKDSSVSFVSILKGNVETKQGFGFLKTVIIDQHFLQRKRHNRLISLMIEHPDLLGVAIDESTAIIVYPDNIFEVFGSNQVLVYDPTESDNVRSNPNGNLGITNLKMHLLIHGDKFNLQTREVIR